MRVELNPFSAWGTSPVVSKVTSVALYVAAAYLLFTAIVGVVDSVWIRVLGVIAAYLAVDTSLMVMRGRTPGTVIAAGIFSLLSFWAVWQVTSGDGIQTAGVVGLTLIPIWVTGLIALFTPAASRWRKENSSSLLAEIQRSRSARKR